MKFIRYAKAISINGLLMISWLIFFQLLENQIGFSIWTKIDGLWLTKIDQVLATNLVGDLTYHHEGDNGAEAIIYTAPFYPDGLDENPQILRLSDIVDRASWKKTQSDRLSTTYLDKRFKYVVYEDSNGTYMRIFNP